jgi:FkbM family methyltransferase
LKRRKISSTILEMRQPLKSRLYDLIRPFHSPFTRALRRRLGRNYTEHPEMELPPPYESTQLDVERHLHDYLHTSPEAISQIVIVGASRAEEIGRLHRVYPRAAFLCFEPNPDTHRILVKTYGRDSRVSISNLALSNAPGKARFYELTMPGNGSLLEPDVDSWAATTRWDDKKMFSFEVEMSTLDREAARLPDIDMLWMDVQGGEGLVLSGGMETLKRTKSVFLEVALVHSPYKGTVLFPKLRTLLEGEGFTCVGLGTDAWNGFGNAFFVRHFENLVCK